MNDMINIFLVVDKSTTELDLRFTYSEYGSFSKSKERIQKLKETVISRYVYKYDIIYHIILYQNDIPYGGFKGLARRKASEKVLLEKAFEIASKQQ